ncbi:hypothetical protein ACHAWF_007516 [Thalassiosira exigua]
MSSFAPRRDNGNAENYENGSKEARTQTDPHVSTDTRRNCGVNHIGWLASHAKKCKKLERSFTDVSQFSIDTRQTAELAADCVKPKSLRADFVHLRGVQVHSKKIPRLDLDEGQEGFQFRSIQRSVSSIESVGGVDRNTNSIVVVPSMDLDEKELQRWCVHIEHYEERQLYHLLLANDPSVSCIVYLTSQHVDEKVVGYYLGLSQGGDVHDKLTRVFMISVPSKSKKDSSLSEKVSSSKPLSGKILEDQNLIKFMKGLIQQTSTSLMAGLCVFTGSNSVERLSDELGIRLLEASGETLHFGTKQGSRQIFAECGVPHPAGTPSAEDDDLLTYGTCHGEEKAYWAHNHRYIRSSHSLAIGIARQIIVHGVRPRKWMVKLNQGFSGKGNAYLNLQRLQDSHISLGQNVENDILDMATSIEKQFQWMKFEDSLMTWYGDEQNVGFRTQIERLGVIAETFIEGEIPTSPSVQAVIEPNDGQKPGGRVSIVSTHEQLLNGQVYEGCINPASEEYRAQIMKFGLKVGNFLSAHGVVGHFSCDFLATKKHDGSYDLNAIEVNLRQGGTTHPQATMALLCGGCICSDGVFRTNANEVRTYIATDCHSFQPRSEGHLVDAIESKTDPLASKIRWQKDKQIGVVFHLFKFAPKGRIGFTAIGRNLPESRLLFGTTKEFLSQMSHQRRVCKSS